MVVVILQSTSCVDCQDLGLACLVYSSQTQHCQTCSVQQECVELPCDGAVAYAGWSSRSATLSRRLQTRWWFQVTPYHTSDTLLLKSVQRQRVFTDSMERLKKYEVTISSWLRCTKHACSLHRIGIHAASIMSLTHSYISVVLNIVVHPQLKY